MKKFNFNYNSPTPGRITILAKTPYPVGNASRITKEVFNTIVSCGFNAVSTADSVENTKKCFETLKGVSLHLIIGSERKNSNEMMELVNEYCNNSILGGHELKDEPKFNELNKVKELYDDIKSVDTEHVIQINLACDYDKNSDIGKEYIGPYTNYPDYLNYFQQLFKPAVWSYDFYPIVLRNGKTIARIEDFYYFMQVFYDKAKQTGRPFWAYCMCMPYLTNCIESETCSPDDPNSSGRPMPTLGELRFEAFSSLAYGAQGIIYWAYTQRPYNQPLKETYYSAPIDINGNKTGLWNKVQIVNKEIIKYNNVFCECEVMEVGHVGKVYPGTGTYNNNYGYFKTITAENEGILVSHIKNNNINYLIIVNHKPLGPQHVTIYFQNPSKVIEMSDIEMPPEEGRRMLGAGGYVIFKIIN